MHICKLNGKVYIGITKDTIKRWIKGTGYKSNQHFYSAIQKYGWDGFLHVVVRTELSWEEACELEKRYIYLFRADEPQYGYNKTKGGEGADLGKNSYSKEYATLYNKTYHEKFREEHGMSSTNYYLTHNPEYKVKHDEQMKKVSKSWYERFKKEHGMSPKAWRKHHPKIKNDS